MREKERDMEEGKEKEKRISIEVDEKMVQDTREIAKT